MQFEQRYADAIRDGSLDLTFRRWRRSQAIAGHIYRTAAGRLEVTDVAVVDPSDVPDADARRAGYANADELRADLRGDPSLPLYRVAIRSAAGADPRDVLAATDTLFPEEATEIERRLARLDRASTSGPWTASTLELIAARPAVRAAELAASVGRETQPFKLDVRKLKALGLTISLERGYRLSPRGEAYRAWVTAR